MYRRIWLLGLVTLALTLTFVLYAPETASQELEPSRLNAPEDLGTAFSYQGYLTLGDIVADGNYDFTFELFDDELAGNQIGSTILKDGVFVTEGQFTVLLDFGDVFDGTSLWLQIGVSPDRDTVPISTLEPRQALRLTPYASFASKSPWIGLIDVPGDLADGDDDTLGALGCSLNQIAVWNGSIWMCGVGDDTLTGLSCGNGQVAKWLDDPGEWACADDIDNDTDTTYSAGTGLDLTGTTFSITSTYQLPQSCANGEIIEWNGSIWDCAIDNVGSGGTEGDITGVDAGDGLYGGGFEGEVGLHVGPGTGISVAPDDISIDGPYRLPQGCGGGKIARWDDSLGEWLCDSDFDALGALSCATGQIPQYNGSIWTCVTGEIGWSLTGNSGTTYGTHFLGTTDGVSLTLAVSGTAALRLEPTAWSPNIIGGDVNNTVGSGVYGATIGGGASGVEPHRITDHFGTIGGGGNNQVGSDDQDPTNAQFATIGGGYGNIISGTHGTIGGGFDNTVTGTHGTVSGGYQNQALDNYATVAGGKGNKAQGENSTVAGGFANRADGRQSIVGGGATNIAYDDYSTVSGGFRNFAYGYASTIAGGYDHYTTEQYATISGGYSHWVTGEGGTISGGYDNTVTGTHGTVSGGYQNQAISNYGTIGGGFNNVANGQYASVPGGNQNVASGTGSFAAGSNAVADHDGSLVWADTYTTTAFTSDHNNQFKVRAWGGSRFEDGAGLWVEMNWLYPIATSTGAYLSSGGAWTNNSDREAKENFTPVDGDQILARLAEVPVTAWNYTSEAQSVRHIGPVAQDFYAAFELGDSERAIGTGDADGVALVAIQALYERSVELESENAVLQQQLSELEGRLTGLETSQNGLATQTFLLAGLIFLLLLLVVGLIWTGWRTGLLRSSAEQVPGGAR